MTYKKRRSQITTAMVSLGLATTVGTVSAQNAKSLVTDIQLRASSSSTPPSGPEGYTRIGYWDVDGGGSEGTDGSTGSWMMALYANKIPTNSATESTSCVTDVQLRASNASTPQGKPKGYTQIGYWDVDGGGSKGTDGSTGHWMMALYANTAPISSFTETETSCVTDVQLRTSSSPTPPSGPSGYTQIGYWDVDGGGSEGTDGSTGSWMMALYSNTAPIEFEDEEDELPAFEDFNLPFQIQPTGSANIVAVPGNMTLRLVPAQPDQIGSVFSQTKINVASGFSTFFTFQITEPSDNKAGDGLVFVVQSDQSNALGEGASGIGYANIPNSVGVEFDIWNNEQWRNDADNNHVGINLNGEFEGPTASVKPSFQDGTIWYAWIDYDGSQLEVRTNQKNGRPSEALLTQPLNLKEILGDTEEAFVGFTASTGGAFANHDILSWTYQKK